MRAFLCVVLLSALVVLASAKHETQVKSHAKAHQNDEWMEDSDNDAHSLEEDEEEVEDKIDAEAAAEAKGEDEDDDDGGRVLEEKDAAESKVQSDIQKMMNQLEEANLPVDEVEIAKRNLDVIAKDARELLTADKSRASNLKLAIKKRMEALRMILEEEGDNNQEVDEEPEFGVKRGLSEPEFGVKRGLSEPEFGVKRGLSEPEFGVKRFGVKRGLSEVESRVNQDIQNIKRQLEETSEIPSNLIEEAKENINMIEKDAKLLASGSSKSKNIQEAIKLRIQAMKEMMKTSNVRDQEEEASDDDDEAVQSSKVDKIHSDIASLESQLQNTHLSRASKKAVEANLHAIEQDAARVSSSASLSEKANLKEAMKLRMTALKQQLEEDSEVAKPRELEEKSSVIIEDIHRAQKAVNHDSTLSKTAKKALKDNLAHMLHDAEELPQAEPARQAKLIKSIHLRMNALKKQAGNQ